MATNLPSWENSRQGENDLHYVARDGATIVGIILGQLAPYLVTWQNCAS
jgi:hypothetical protein